MTKIAMVRGPSYGTALSVLLSHSRREHEIKLWVREPSIAESISRERKNPVYLTDVPIPSCVSASTDLREVLHDAHVVVGVLPSAHTRAVFTEALPFLSPETAVVSAAKGLEPATHLRMSEVIEQVFSLRFVPRIAVLSGPSFAVEAARGEPTAVVLAAPSSYRVFAANVRRYSSQVAEFLQEELASSTFRLYTNDDVLGVELAGAMKNVMAIAAGACQGLGLGQNSLAALITRGLAEMTRLAVALGGRAETLSGLAGLGDLVLTCTGTLSRNR